MRGATVKGKLNGGIFHNIFSLNVDNRYNKTAP
jgi:hypothetical protein